MEVHFNLEVYKNWTKHDVSLGLKEFSLFFVVEVISPHDKI